MKVWSVSLLLSYSMTTFSVLVIDSYNFGFREPPHGLEKHIVLFFFWGGLPHVRRYGAQPGSPPPPPRPFPKVLDESRLRQSGALAAEPLSVPDKAASEVRVAAFFEVTQDDGVEEGQGLGCRGHAGVTRVSRRGSGT